MPKVWRSGWNTADAESGQPLPSSAFGIPDQVRDRLYFCPQEKGGVALGGLVLLVIQESRSDIRDPVSLSLNRLQKSHWVQRPWMASMRETQERFPACLRGIDENQGQSEFPWSRAQA